MSFEKRLVARGQVPVCDGMLQQNFPLLGHKLSHAD